MVEGPVRAGDVLAGKYQIESLLGAGGMGMVVAARHLQLGERVALKFLLPEMVANRDVVARFLREARAAARIRSDHIARVTDVGQLETGSPYMVMEYLEGCDLHVMVERQGPLGVGLAVDVVLQACEALVEAHGYGIVHRDLKPANVFMTPRPDGTFFVKVLDFGISKPASGDAEVGLTKTATMLGSPAYMSPEQMLRARDVDLRTDIWACGIVLYEALTGQPPFDGRTVPEVCAQIAAAPHMPMGQARPDVPPGLCQVIDRALAKSPADRFQSIAELATALGPFGLPESGLSVRRIEATWLAFHPGLAPGVTGGAAAPVPPMMITRPRGGADVQSTVGPVAVSGEAPGHGRSVFLMSAAAVAVALGIVAAAFFAFTRSTASVASPQDDRPAASSSVAAAASPPPVESVPGAPLPSAAPSSLPAVAPSVPAPVASSPGRPSTPRAPAVPQKAPSRSRPRPASEVFDSRK